MEFGELDAVGAKIVGSPVTAWHSIAEHHIDVSRAAVYDRE